MTMTNAVVLIEAERELGRLPYNLVRKRVGEREYLYEVIDRLNNGKSLGPMSPELERRLAEYKETKASLQQRTLTGAAAQLQDKVTQLQGMVTSDQAALSSVVKGSDDEQIDQAQLALDQDQLNDAKEDLARASGDERGAIQQELTAHEAEMKTFLPDLPSGESLSRKNTRLPLADSWNCPGAMRSRSPRRS